MTEVNAGNLNVNINASTGNFQRGIKDAKKQVKSFGTQVTDMKRTLLKLSAGFAVVAGTMALLAKSSINMNKGLANVQTLIPGNIARINELKKSIQDMSIAVNKSTADLTDGTYQVISAFGDTADTVLILEIAAKAATAGVATTTDAINLLSAVTKGYGDTSLEAVNKVADLAFQAVKLGQTTFPELAASLGRVVPLAAEFGIKQKELFAVMATGTGVTGGAAEVTTQFRNVLQSLMAPTTDMILLFKRLEYANGKAMLSGEGLIGTLNLIIKEAEKSGEPLQKYIGSVEGQTIALALAGSQADVYVEKLAAMDKATGVMNEAFETQKEGINSAGFALGQMHKAFVVLTQRIGDTFLDQIEAMTIQITDMTTSIADNETEIQNWGDTLVSVLKAVEVAAKVSYPILKGWVLIAGSIKDIIVSDYMKELEKFELPLQFPEPAPSGLKMHLPGGAVSKTRETKPSKPSILPEPEVMDKTLSSFKGLVGIFSQLSASSLNFRMQLDQDALALQMSINKTTAAFERLGGEEQSPSSAMEQLAESSSRIFKAMSQEMIWELEHASFFFTKDVLSGGWRYGFQELRHLAQEALHNLAGNLVVTIERELIDRIYSALTSEAVKGAIKVFTKPFKDIADYIWKGSSGAGGLKALFKSQTVQDIIMKPFENTLDFYKWIWEGKEGGGGLKGLFKSEELKSIISAPFKATSKIFKWIWEGESGNGGLKALFTSDWFQDEIVAPFKVLGNLGTMVWHGTEFGSSLEELFTAGWFEDALKSPFKFMGNLGTLIWHGAEAASGIYDLLTADWFQDAIKDPWQTLKNVGKWIWRGVEGVGGIVNFLTAGWFYDAISDPWKVLKNVGKWILVGVEGVSGALKKAIEFAIVDPVIFLLAELWKLAKYLYGLATGAGGGGGGATIRFPVAGGGPQGDEGIFGPSRKIATNDFGFNANSNPTADFLQNTTGALAAWYEYIDSLDEFANGGIVGGRIGQPRVVVAHGGETISKAGTPPQININVTGNNILDDNTANRLANTIMDKLSTTMRQQQRYTI